MIRAEAAAIAIVGFGLLFGWATARVLEYGSQPIRFTLPVGTLAVIAVGTVVAALVAAALPASWASRQPVLRGE